MQLGPQKNVFGNPTDPIILLPTQFFLMMILENNNKQTVKW